MFNNQFSGGWRFGDRPTSVEALYQNPQGPNNDFLKKVAALSQDPSKQGLLDQALTADPLQSMIDAPGANGWGNDRDQMGGQSSNGSQARGATSLSDGGNAQTLASGAGFAPNFGAGAKGFATGGPIGGLLAAVMSGNKTAPVYDLAMPGMNGYYGNDYGTSMSLQGAPNAQQAQTMADSFARDFAGYSGGYGTSSSLNGAPNASQAQSIADSFAAQMAMDGFGGYGASAGDSFGGYGGFGAGDYGDGTDR
jgi:hypothetical protein